jgi:DNA-binding CsgD family transcriptional regulator
MKRIGQPLFGRAAGGSKKTLPLMELIDQLSHAKTADESWALAARHMAALGVNGLSYVGAPFSKAHRAAFSTLPSSAQEIWLRMAEKSPRSSPAWKALQRREFGPIRWGLQACARTRKPRAWLEYCEEVAAAGLVTNMTFPCWQATPASQAMVAFHTTLRDSEFDEWCGARFDFLVGSAAAISHRMSALLQPKDELNDITLTSREIECLHWLASGLHNDRIADRVGITEPTVTFHLKNARQKLGAQTREQALVKAALLGLISP